MTEGKVAFVFPGQGAQAVGMGRDIYDTYDAARAIFNRADEVLAIPLSKLIFEGPEEELRLTINAQPALVTVSYALLTAAREAAADQLPQPAFAAGHSLGEYTALAAAGVLDFADTVYLARERGRLMHEAGQKTSGGMAAVIGMEEAVLEEICSQCGTCIANINSPGQIVISGASGDIARATDLAKEKGAARVIPLQVSGAFHSPLMRAAVEGMAVAIEKLTFREPAFAIIGNTTARPLTTAVAIKQELLDQLANCVQWQRSVEYLVFEGVDTFYEIGPGKVLTGLIRRIAKDAGTVNIGDAKAVAALTSGGN